MPALWETRCSASTTWAVYDDLSRDKRVTFIPEPAEVEPAWKRHTRGLFTGTNVWTDAYLAALALVQGMKLVTFDRAFTRIRELESLIL